MPFDGRGCKEEEPFAPVIGTLQAKAYLFSRPQDPVAVSDE
jgi:hypothetical protein